MWEEEEKTDATSRTRSASNPEGGRKGPENLFEIGFWERASIFQTFSLYPHVPYRDRILFHSVFGDPKSDRILSPDLFPFFVLWASRMKKTIAIGYKSRSFIRIVFRQRIRLLEPVQTSFSPLLCRLQFRAIIRFPDRNVSWTLVLFDVRTISWKQ